MSAVQVSTASSCWLRAAEAEVQAAQITDRHLRAVYQRIARHWSVLARSYEFADCVEGFLLDAKKTKNEIPGEPNSEIIIPPTDLGQLDLPDGQQNNLMIAHAYAFTVERVANVT